MKFLTKRIGRFPLGIWIVLVFLLISGLVLLLFAQALSFFAWDAAYSLGLQEDSRYSTDIVARTMGAISWGEAGADVLVQSQNGGTLDDRPMGDPRCYFADLHDRESRLF